jgi:signal transduction histidine kinase/ActR/RegA family two-component response regulator
MLDSLNKVPFIRNFLFKILKQQPDPINQARIRMIFYGLLLSICLTLILIPIYLIQGPRIQLIRAVLIFAAVLTILKFLTVKPIWKEAAHGLQIILTLLIWSNTFILIHSVNIITLQYVFLVIILGFYVLGIFWGIVYSVINVIPIVLFIILNGQNNIAMIVSPQQVGNSVFYIILCYNFILIIFAHYHFFRAFQKTIQRLNVAGKNQKLLNERLRQTMKQAEISSQAKLDFLSTMSHELRTPLNGVIGMTDLLLLENPRKEQEENLNILKFSAESLLSLINDILDFNKIGSDKLDLEFIDFNLADLLRNSCASLNLKAREKGLKLIMHTDAMLSDVMVTGDPTRLSQVIVNLVSNAVKFTPSGTITVSATVVNASDDAIKVHFSVKDTGIGIPKDKQSIIFEPFMQASENTTRKYGGTGLGLAIVKLLLELQESNIHLESTPDKGSEFSFDLVFGFSRNPDSLSTEKKKLKPADLSKLRVLVAEDNAVNILLMKKLLSKWHIKPVIAENGEEVIELLKKENFDVILMDIHMPVMDGFQTTSIIRRMKDEQKSTIHIIALTASVSHNARTNVEKAGINDYLQKPFNVDELRNKLQEIYYLKTVN